MWEIRYIDDNAVIIPKDELLCPICGDKLLLHDFNASYSNVDKIYHCDAHMKCVNCSLWVIFGIPISKDDMTVLQNSKYHGRIITNIAPIIAELQNFSDNEIQIIRNRLEKLGYW